MTSSDAPMTVTEPSACAWCGIRQQDHFRRWHAEAGWHGWTPPTQDQIKARMLARREARDA